MYACMHVCMNVCNLIIRHEYFSSLAYGSQLRSRVGPRRSCAAMPPKLGRRRRQGRGSDQRRRDAALEKRRRRDAAPAPQGCGAAAAAPQRRRRQGRGSDQRRKDAALAKRRKLLHEIDAERAEPAERADRAERPERAERAERAERDEQPASSSSVAPHRPLPSLSSSPLSVARFGSDFGGVITQHLGDFPRHRAHANWHLRSDSEVPNALDTLRLIVGRFGQENVFIISRVGRNMRKLAEIWLHDTMNICGRTGILRRNIRFCADVSGPNGKGPIAADLGLSHFVDDKEKAIESIWADTAGNSREAIIRHAGQLFHFARSGTGNVAPVWFRGASRAPPNLVPVANWESLLAELNVGR